MTDLSTEGNRIEPELVSVVIAAYNEEQLIGECLKSLAGQDYPRVEIVVVDDCSTDSTPDIVANFPGVDLVRVPHLGAGAARNRGAARARGDILVFLDADMIFPPHFIEKLIAPIVGNGAPGSFTKEIFVANLHKRWARAHQLGRGLPLDCHFPPNFPNRWENFRAIRRELFTAVGGFDETGHGEDVSLGRKLGALAEAAPGADCLHHEPETLRDIYRSARWYGQGERILERPRPKRSHSPLRSIARGTRLAIRHKMPSLLVYRLVWDWGTLVGLFTRHGISGAK